MHMRSTVWEKEGARHGPTCRKWCVTRSTSLPSIFSKQGNVGNKLAIAASHEYLYTSIRLAAYKDLWTEKSAQDLVRVNQCSCIYKNRLRQSLPVGKPLSHNNVFFPSPFNQIWFLQGVFFLCSSSFISHFILLKIRNVDSSFEKS